VSLAGHTHPTVFFNVKDYGATGDGSTNDLTAINNASSAASTAGGGIVWFPPGTYMVNAPVLMRTNVTLMGGGRGAATIKMMAVANQHILDYPAGGQTNFAVRDLTLDGNKASATGTSNGLSLVTAVNALIENVEIKNVRTRGINSYQCVGVTLRNVRVVDSGVGDDLDTGTYTGIAVWGSNYSLENCQVKSASGIGIALVGASSDVRIDGCEVDASGYIGIALGGAANTDVVVSDCSVLNVGGNAIDTGNAVRVAVSGNVIKDCAITGICMDGGSHQTIVGNQVYSPAQKGIDVSTSTGGGCTVVGNSVIEPGHHGIQVVGVPGTAVTANVVRNVGQFWNGITVYNGSGTVITGNQVTDSRAPKLSQFGVHITGNSADCLVNGNLLEGNSGQYYDDSTGSGNVAHLVGSGSPEAVITADVGSTFIRKDGGSSTTLYVKESGSGGNIGWVGYGTGGGGGSTDATKNRYRVKASSGNPTLSGHQTLDGVSCVTGDRVLVYLKGALGGGDGYNNGIWVVQTGAWTRPTDFDSAAEAAGAEVFVEQGTSFGGQVFRTDYPSTGTWGTTALEFHIAGNLLQPVWSLGYPWPAGQGHSVYDTEMKAIRIFDGAWTHPRPVIPIATSEPAGAPDGTIWWDDDATPTQISGASLASAQSWTATQTFRPATTAGVPVIQKGLASQTGDLQQNQDSTGAVLSAINATGQYLEGGRRVAPLTSRLTTAPTSTSVTYAASGLSVNVEAGKVYHFKVRGQYRTAATGTGIGLTMGGTATATGIRWETLIYGLTATTYTHQAQSALNVVAASTTGVAAANTDYGFVIEGEIRVNAAGTFRLDFRSEVAASTVTIQPDTTLILQEIA
jgi:polygalacturonase